MKARLAVSVRRAACSLFAAVPALAQEVLPPQPQPMPQPAPSERVFQARAHDLPGLYAAIQQGKTGKLFADPDVAAALQSGIEAYLRDIQPWREEVDFLMGLAPKRAQAAMRFERALHRLDWRDLRDLELSAIVPKLDEPALDATDYVEPQLAFGVRPTDAGKGRVEALFDEVVQKMRDAPPSGLAPAADQDVLGKPGLRLMPSEEPAVDAGPFFYGVPEPVWARRVDSLLACGSGASPFDFRFEADEPHVAIGMDFRLYTRMMSGLLFGSEGAGDVFAALGIDNLRWIEWRLGTNGDLLQDDIRARFDGEPHGIAGALLKSAAPLPSQPLPEGTLVQLRCGFELASLLPAIDRLLTIAGVPTLGEQKLYEDIERAWTGGIAFALARPAGAGVVPRMHLSFGIVDEAALGRLLARVTASPSLKLTPRKLGDREVQVLSTEGLPPALTPCHVLVDGVLHVAESLPSLKAQLAAIDAGAAPAMPVDKGLKPTGTGTTLPGLELRFDAAAIHVALQKVWLPLAALAGGEEKPYLMLKDMPEADLVAEHLHSGRAVLRRSGTTYSLASTGTLGGPFLQGIATSFGPMLTTAFSTQREYQLNMVRCAIVSHQLQTLHAAIATFEQQEKRKPVSLGELVGKGLARELDLLVPGDTAAEPLTHDGKQVGTTSYRYYPQALKVAPDGEEMQAELISIRKMSWWRFALATDGTLHTGYGEFAEDTLDAIEKKAKEK